MSHIWCLDYWKKYINTTSQLYTKGLRMHYDSSIPIELHSALAKFVKWLRTEYSFPVRVNVYVKSERRIKAMDGEMVVGTCWRPYHREMYPYIRLAVGDYQELVLERGDHRAVLAILHTFAHELTHYFQYINNLKLTAIGEERQATIYAQYIIDEYEEYLQESSIEK